MQGTRCNQTSYLLSLLWSKICSVFSWFYDLDSFEEYFVDIGILQNVPQFEFVLFLTFRLRLWVWGKKTSKLKDTSHHITSGAHVIDTVAQIVPATSSSSNPLRDQERPPLGPVDTAPLDLPNYALSSVFTTMHPVPSRTI